MFSPEVNTKSFSISSSEFIELNSFVIYLSPDIADNTTINLLFLTLDSTIFATLLIFLYSLQKCHKFHYNKTH